jgi:hypothetical protein
VRTYYKILEKKIVLCATKKINIPTLVLSGKKNLNEKKHHKPSPLQVKWSVPKEAKEAHWIWKNRSPGICGFHLCHRM